MQLHSEHFLHAVEGKRWREIGEFVAPHYEDQWGQDRALMLARLRAVLRTTRGLQFRAEEAGIQVDGGSGQWRGLIRLEADAGEVSTLLKERVNVLDSPFVLKWQQGSGKPWDWKLVSVTNPALEFSAPSY